MSKEPLTTSFEDVLALLSPDRQERIKKSTGEAIAREVGRQELQKSLDSK